MMRDSRNPRPVLLVPLLLALLAAPAWPAPPGGKASHYPGQDCSKCHKLRGKAAETRPAKSAPKTGAGTQSGTVPAQGTTGK